MRLRFEVADRVDHLPGQHYVLRLRAPDDYTAQRSYSVASDPDDPLLELMVECLPDGEVSEFMHDEARVGDVFELRGPIGGWFTWTGEVPAVAVAGGSGVVPIVAMIRYARRLGLEHLLRVVAVARTLDALPYADELRDARRARGAHPREPERPGGRPALPGGGRARSSRAPSAPTSAARSGSRRTPSGCSASPACAPTRSGWSSSARPARSCVLGPRSPHLRGWRCARSRPNPHNLANAGFAARTARGHTA